MKIVLGVTGGIAAYKAVSVLRLLAEAGHNITVVPTAAALKFVGAPTWEALSGRPILADLWNEASRVPHVTLGREADLVLVVPATADFLAKAAHGLADDPLTNLLLVARCPVVFMPAMHTEMWEHAATSANVETLRKRGVRVCQPATGRLTGSDSGVGRLPDPEEIVSTALNLAVNPRPQDLTGLHVLVTAGGTREPLDPVRFLGNRSSGKQGWALARAAAARGAEVTLVGANVSLPEPIAVGSAPVELVKVESTTDLQNEVLSHAMDVDVVVMAAAPADFAPIALSASKLKKKKNEDLVLRLTQTPDVLSELGVSRAHGGMKPDAVIVGFAAETGDSSRSIVELAREKLARKQCDLIVACDVSGGAVFGEDDVSATIVFENKEIDMPSMSKDALAHEILDAAMRRRIVGQ